MIQGFMIGVDTKYKFQVVSTVDFDLPNTIWEVAFMRKGTLLNIKRWNKFEYVYDFQTKFKKSHIF